MKIFALALISLLVLFSYDAEATYIPPGAIVTEITNAACGINSITQNACAAFYGYYNPIWFGATGSGSGDDEPAMAAASTAACASGLRVKFTPGTYQKQRQFDSGCNGLVWFADPQNPAYDSNNEHAAVLIHDNTGFYTSVNNCGYNQNGFVDQVIDGINFKGDGGQQGTVLFCNSHNTSGGDQTPRLYARNGSSALYGATVGCSLKLTAVTGAPQCFTGTGTTQNNLVTARFENWKFEENALGVGGGNISDLKIDKNSEIAGNACGAINATLNGTEGVYMGAFRTEENGVTGISGVCGAASPAIEVSGPYWQIDTQFQNNEGVDLLFDNSCGADSITGGYSGDGLAGTTGAESIIAFNASCAGTISFNGFMGSVVGAFGQVAPKYFAQNISGTNVISFIGGNLDSTQYTIARDLITAGGLTYKPIITLGQSISGISAEQTINYQPGLLTAVNATKGVYGKFVQASTVDNIEGSAITFSCVSNPTITLTNCHADTSCATSPTVIGTVTVTASGQAFDGSISNAVIAAGEYVAWSMTAGTCASVDIAATAQVHSN